MSTLSPTERTAARELAIDVAREAGDILLSYLGKLDPARLGRKSSSRDLQTDADLASERHIVARLREAFPDFAIEAEEEVNDELSSATEDRPRWFLDPLDGTNNFVHGLPLFAVSIGLFSGSAPEVAVIRVPLLDETFHAELGGGAYLNDSKLAVSKAEELGESILATGFPYRRGELEHDNLDNFSAFFYDVRGVRRMGSAAIDLAYTAAGRLDGFWELHLEPHDVAAGALLVREAGGVVTDADGGDDWLRGKSIVAAGPALHPRIRERIRH